MNLLFALVSIIPYVSAAPAQDGQTIASLHARNDHDMNRSSDQGHDHEAVVNAVQAQLAQYMAGYVDNTYNGYSHEYNQYEQEPPVYEEAPMTEEMIAAMEQEVKELEREEKKLEQKQQEEGVKLEADICNAGKVAGPEKKKKKKKGQSKEGAPVQPKNPSASSSQYPTHNYYSYPQSSSSTPAYHQYPGYNYQQPYPYSYQDYPQPNAYPYGYNPYAYNYNPNSYYAQQAAYEQQLKEYERQKQQYEQQQQQFRRRPPLNTDLPQPRQPPKAPSQKPQQQYAPKPGSQNRPSQVSYTEYEDYPGPTEPPYDHRPATYHQPKQQPEKEYVSTVSQPEKFRAPKYDIQEVKGQYIRKKPHRLVNKSVVTSDDHNDSFEPPFNRNSAAKKLLSKPEHLVTTDTEWVAKV